MKKEINELKIWITGGSRGIGLETAKLFIEEGATVVLSARSKESFREILPELAPMPNVFIFPCDVSNKGQVKETHDKIKAVIGDVDVLINNAGIFENAPYMELTTELLNNMFSVNVYGVLSCSQAVLPAMLKSKSGIILNISSVVTREIFPQNGAYSASKWAAMALSRTLREEVRGTGVKVVDVIPGAAITDIWHPKMVEKFSDKMMKAGDVALAVFNAVMLNMESRMMVEEIYLKPQSGNL